MSFEVTVDPTEKAAMELGKSQVQLACQNLGIPFVVKEDAMFSEFDRALNNDVPLRYSNTALHFIDECIYYKVRISEIQVMFGGYKFLFEGHNGDAIIHKFSYGADDGYLETMGFEFDDGDVSTNTAADLAELIAEEQGNKRVFED